MEAFTTHRGKVAAMDRSNVDTDQIIPKQFLKRIDRTGFGQFLFFDWRFIDGEIPNPDFELNQPANQGATILLVRVNFGNGSSREHAVWALADYGFRCVIGESFADIFYNNCFKNGVLPIVLPKSSIDELFRRQSTEELQITVDLEEQTVSDSQCFCEKFEVDAFRRYCLMNGLDDIGLTLQHESRIESYERARGMPEPHGVNG